MSRKQIVKPSRLRIDRKKDETSQMGRLINYLNREEDKGAMIDEALKNFYLVEALKAEGVRSREDFRDIVYKCAEKLIAQARSILHIGGIDPQSVISGMGTEVRGEPSVSPVPNAENNHIVDEEKDDKEEGLKYKNDGKMKKPEEMEYSEEEEKEITEGINNFFNEL